MSSSPQPQSDAQLVPDLSFDGSLGTTGDSQKRELCTHCDGHGTILRRSPLCSDQEQPANHAELVASGHAVGGSGHSSPLECEQQLQYRNELSRPQRHPQPRVAVVEGRIESSGSDGGDVLPLEEAQSAVECDGFSHGQSVASVSPTHERFAGSEFVGTLGRRRSSRRKNGNVLYDQKYHPVDQILRPKSARTLKHRGQRISPHRNQRVERRTVGTRGEEVRKPRHSLQTATISQTSEATLSYNNPSLYNAPEDSTGDMEPSHEDATVLADASRAPERSSPTPVQDSSPRFTGDVADLHPMFDSDSEDQLELFSFGPSEDIADSGTTFTVQSADPPADNSGSHETLPVGNASDFVNTQDTQSNDDELHATLDLIIQHASRALAAINGKGTSPIVVAPNSASSISSGRHDSFSPTPSTPTSSRTTATTSHSRNINDLPDTGFIGPDGSPSDVMDIIHGLTPPPRPAPATSPRARGTPPGLRTPHHFSQPHIPSDDLSLGIVHSRSRSKSKPAEYYIRPYESVGAKKQARLASSHNFAIWQDGPSSMPTTHVNRYYNDNAKENAHTGTHIQPVEGGGGVRGITPERNRRLL